MINQQLTQDPTLQPCEYFLAYEDLEEYYKDAESRYKEAHPDKDYSQEIFDIVYRFLKKNGRYGYLKFGPYWWAIKAILNERGYTEFNKDSVILLRDAYRVKNPDTGEFNDQFTIIAAYQFKDHYNAHYFQGNRDFDIFPSGEIYSLWDEEWEDQFPRPAVKDEY